MEPKIDGYLSYEEAAHRLNISIATLYRKIKDGELEKHKFRGLALVKVTDVERLLKVKE